jgi:hypothetical protein
MNTLINAGIVICFILLVGYGTYLALSHKRYMKHHNYRPPLFE